MPRKPPEENGEKILPHVRTIGGQPLDPAKPPAQRRHTDKEDKGKEKLLSQETQAREYELITPLMGGGVSPGENDPVTPVRGAEIRGQLRFWWRACRASQFSSIPEMKKREDEIWGSAETPSMVTIEAHGKKSGEESAFRVVADSKKPGKPNIQESEKIAPYAAFPLLPDKNEQRKAGWESEKISFGVTFTLTISYPRDEELMKEVKAALWAWETFGGLGARTRRGFGAIRLRKEGGASVDPYPEDSARIEKSIRERLREFANGPHRHPDIPQLNEKIRIEFTSVKRNESDAWKHLIRLLKDFRQNRFGSAYGQSKWPEANALRLRAGKKVRFSEDVPYQFQKVVNKFPRAVFGLPLLFHLPHDSGVGDATLQGADGPNGEKRERLSSPIILRPLACKNGRGIGMAVVLDAPQIPLLLKGGVSNQPPPSAALDAKEASEIEPLKGNPDALQVFLDRVKNS